MIRERVRDLDVDVGARVREALERAGIDRMRLSDDHDRSHIDSRRMADEIRARVRESLERSDAIRERSHERALEEMRRNSARMRDRHWY